MDKENIGNLDIEYSAELRDLRDTGDTEEAHKLADDILCIVLRKLGLNQTVDAYREIHKWYA